MGGHVRLDRGHLLADLLDRLAVGLGVQRGGDPVVDDPVHVLTDVGGRQLGADARDL